MNNTLLFWNISVLQELLKDSTFLWKAESRILVRVSNLIRQGRAVPCCSSNVGQSVGRERPGYLLKKGPWREYELFLGEKNRRSFDSIRTESSILGTFNWTLHSAQRNFFIFRQGKLFRRHASSSDNFTSNGLEVGQGFYIYYCYH